MKKDYKIFNDIKIDLDEYEEIEFSKSENDEIKSIMKNKIKYKKTPYKKIVASLLIVFLGIGIIFNPEVMAQIKNILHNIDDVWNSKYPEIEDYVYNIDKSAEDKNIKVSFKDIILDNGKFIISANIDDSKFDPLKDLAQDQINDWSIDKWGYKDTVISLSTDSTEVIVDGTSFKNWNPIPNLKERNANGSTDVVIEQDLNFIEKEGDNIKVNSDSFPNYIDPNKVYNFKIKIQKIYLLEKSKGESTKGYGAVVNGNWSVNAAIKGKNLIGVSNKYEIDKDINLIVDGQKININLKSMNFSPIYLGLDYSCVNKRDYLIMFKVYNDNGEEYKSIKINQEHFTENISSENRNINFNNQFLNIYKETKYVKIVPVVLNTETCQSKAFEDKAIKIDLNR